LKLRVKIAAERRQNLGAAADFRRSARRRRQFKTLSAPPPIK
jgi:hypothetical protein